MIRFLFNLSYDISVDLDKIAPISRNKAHEARSWRLKSPSKLQVCETLENAWFRA